MDRHIDELLAGLSDWQDRGLYDPAPLPDPERRAGVRELHAAVEAIRNLSEAADADTLIEVVLAALGLAVGDADPDVQRDVAAALGRLAPTEAVVREVAELVAMRAQVLTHAVALWAHDCEQLPALHSPPADIQEAARGMLDHVLALRRSAQAASRLDGVVLWSTPITAALVAAADQCRKALAESAFRARLWVLRRHAEERGLDDLLPTLSDALWRVVDRPATNMVAPRDDALAAARAELDTWSQGGRVYDVMAAAQRGHLSERDLELIRVMVKHHPGVWATAHLAALRRDGFTAAVHLVRSAETDAWTATRVLRVSPADIAPAGVSLGWATGPAPLLPDQRGGGTVPVARVRTPLPPEVPAENLALAQRRLHVAGIDFRLFGDEEGLWLLGKNDRLAVKARCESSVERVTGWHAQFPLVRINSNVADVKPFRPGPLRPLLTIHGQHLDRTASPRAYIITVGESCFRSMLGWSLGQATTELNLAAASAGIRSGTELRRVLAEETRNAPDPLDLDWLRALGPSPQGERLSDWLATISDRSGALLGAEVDTLEAITGELQPVDGDVFVLVHTRTATSLVASWIIERRLRTRFPNGSFERVACDALIQAERLDATRHHTPDAPMKTVYEQLLGVVLSMLIERGADPVLVMSGGLKWQANVMLELGGDRHLPCVYKSGDDVSEESIAPVAIRLDWLRPSTPHALPQTLDPGFDPLPDAAGGVMLTVGVRLLKAFRWSPDNHQAQPQPATLAAWARAEVQRLGEQWWTLTPELTAFEAWRRHRAPTLHLHDMGVALVRTRAQPGEEYVEGQVCGQVVQQLLEERGVRVRVDERWDVMNLKSVRAGSGLEQAHQLHAELLDPLRTCIEENGQPDVVFTGGQKLTAAFAHLVARQNGCWAFFAPEPVGGSARLWLAHPKSDPEDTAKVVASA